MSNFYSLNKIYSKIIEEQNSPDVSSVDDFEDEPDEEEIAFRLSNDISDELTKTMNSFTATTAKIIKKHYATKDLYEKFQNTYAKIRNLIDAAKNTNLKK